MDTLNVGDYAMTITCCENAIVLPLGIQTPCSSCNKVYTAISHTRKLNNVPSMNASNDLYCCGNWRPYPAHDNDTQCPVCHFVFNFDKLLVALDDRIVMPIDKVLGQDDWCFYARTITGRLAYTVTDIHNAWSDAPHGGMHECNCPGETMTCNVDNTWMLQYVIDHKDEMYWQNAEGFLSDTREALGWPIEKDEEFIKNSRRYLTNQESANE